MRILFWSQIVSPGGGVRLLSQLAPAIARNPAVDRLTLALPTPIPDMESWRAAEGKLDLVAVKTSILEKWAAQRKGRFKGETILKGFARRALLPQVRTRSQLRQLQALAASCDVVYCFWPHLAPFPLLDKPVVCTIQDTTFLDFPEILGGAAAYQEFERTKQWLDGAQQVIVSSVATRDRLAKLFGSPFSQIQVIHHNIGAVSSGSHTPERSSRLEGLPPRYIIYPANINAHKNHEVLLTAWSRLPQRCELPLILVGDGTQIFSRDWSMTRNEYWQQDRLVGLVNRLGLERGKAFQAFGYVSDRELAWLIQNATALVMPSLSEGGGSYPVEEALNMGIPVLCSDIPVMREHFAQRTAKPVWFDPLSPESLLRAVDQLLADYPVYKSSAEQGIGDKRPTWDEIAARYVEVFQAAAVKAPES